MRKPLFFCSKCHVTVIQVTGRYCRPCHAEYARTWRKSHPMNPEQRRKDNCRSYANTYLRRGKIKREPCARCGDLFAEMHHADYSKPLEIEWLCRPCHLAHHRKAA